MTEDFFDTIRYDNSIDQKLEKRMAARVKLAFSLANVQQSILENLGYKNLAPLSVDYDRIWFYIKDNKFHTVDDGNRIHTYRRWEHLYGDILLCLNGDGYHLCEPSNEKGSNKYKVEDGEYYFLWENDEYTKLTYMLPVGYCKDEFEYVKEESFVAIKYHEKEKYGDSFMNEEERLIKKPRKDTLISRKKGICHIEVFLYFYKDKIVVYDDGKTIVYNNTLDVLCEKEFYYADWDRMVIWNNEHKSYLLFPPDGTVYDLTECRDIILYKDNEHWWLSAMAYKDIFVFYSAHRFRVDDNSYYDDDGNYWSSDYNEEDIPIRNTIGHIFDSSFNLLREFNVIGEIEQLKEMGNTIVLIANSSSVEDHDTKAYYNVNSPNLTRHNDKSNEEFSIPDITFRDMVEYDNQNLVIVKTRVPASDFIDLTESTSSQLFRERCGVYSCTDWHKGKYKKIVECKYDYIKSLPVKDDYNVYYAGVVGLGDDNKFDFYINHQLVLQGIPFKRGHSVKLINDGTFIQITNSDGKKGILRNGKFILDPIYKDVKTFVKYEENYDPDTNCTSEILKYLFAVTDDELFGICSSSGKLILPKNYSTIDMDDNFRIVLVRDFNAEVDDENDETIEDMIDYGGIYETGYYDEEKDVIVTERAKFKDGEVLLDDEGYYVWDGCFRYLKEDDYSGWTDQELKDAADIAYEGHSRLELGLED